jgi:PAS domain S-box-containing protein
MSTAKEEPGRGLWALWFVFASLVALVAVPAYLGRRAAEVQTRISDVVEESSRLSSGISLLKARQMIRVEGYLLTGDRSFREPYIASKAQEDSLFSRLGDLARNLDFEVRERVAELQTASTSWHFENYRMFELDSIPPGQLESTLRSYNQLQTGTRELDRAIESEVEAGRREMTRARRVETRITFVLALLALGSTFVVGRVGFRLRDLGSESETRRRDAVRARREIDALLEATGDGVLGIDLEGKCTSLNRAGVELLGYTDREIEGRDIHETLYHSRADGSPCPREESPILSALVEGRSVDSPDGAVLWRRRRRPFPARWSLRPMLDGRELRGAVLTFTDMTEIQEKEEALRRAIGQREDVVSIVSHDLRNPLGVVLAASDLLLDLPLDEGERRRQAEIIRRSGKRMQSLIEDLLDVARIEERAFVVRPSLEELDPILQEASDLFRDQAERRGVNLECESTDGPRARARVDRDRILQALANLLDNAIRLTPPGGQVSLALREEPGFVRLEVTDNGPGVEPELLPRLFDRFAQSRSGGGGAGLGLTIVKGVAEAHGGDVVVTSAPGRGSTFAIRLPRAAPAAGVSS